VSARYRIHPEYAANRQCFQLSDAQKRKLARAGLRRERRLDAGHPERKGILESLAKLSFAETARSRIAELWGKNEQAAKRVVHAIDCRKYFISFDTVGQITTPISSLPRDLKDHLLIEGEEAVFVDVSNAHYCFLPRLLKDRIDYHRGNARWVIGFTSATSLGVLFVRWDAKPDAIAHMELERIRLVDDLSMGDFYASLGGEGKARDSVKKLANTVLNMQNEKATKIPFYQSLRRRFPASFGVLEDIKRKDHRNASTPFRHYTAESMKLALLELQAHNITAIPQTDALLCRRRDVECASRALGAAVFKVSGGVRCKAGGIRFEPQPQACIQGIEKEPHCSELIAA
jgi:hypothetical protein